MRRAWSVAAGVVLALCAGSQAWAQKPPAEKPVQVMVVAAWHFDNPGADLVNVKADDVLVPKRQRELEEVTARLARFRPTKVAVEREAKTPDLALPAYRQFTQATLGRQRGEEVQIGFRLAKRLGHAAVYGIDEQTGAGEPDYFPFGKVAEYAGAHGKGEWLNGLFGPAKAKQADFERRQPRHTMAQLLAVENDRAANDAMHRSGYYALLTLGDGEAQPGAELNAYWYMRNAKIFSKLAHVAEPGDRIVVVFGGGHAYWLRHFAESTPGFELVDAQPYLTGRR